MAYDGKPEHPGRVRGVGKGVGLKAYFGDSPRLPKKQKSDDEIVQVVLNTMSVRWQEKLAELGGTIDPSQIMDVMTQIFTQPYRPPPEVNIH